jgi:hypothetical protein
MATSCSLWEVRDHLKAFRLIGRKYQNVHVCGEAYSDFQGHIEGALSRHAMLLQRSTSEFRSATATNIKATNCTIRKR